MGWGQGWGEATERLLKDCVLGVSLPTLVLALDRGVWLQSLTICPWDRAVTPLRQPLHPRAGCHPSNGGPSGRAVCPPCLPPPTGPWLGAAPRLTPKPRRPAVKEGKVGVPGFGGRARGHLTCRRIDHQSAGKALSTKCAGFAQVTGHPQDDVCRPGGTHSQQRAQVCRTPCVECPS